MKKNKLGITAKDSFSTINIPSGSLFGKTTVRWRQRFGIGEPLPFDFISSLALVKKACAFANRDCGVLDSKTARAIGNICDQIIKGEYKDQFPVSYIQSGSGTITNMNMNEVIARAAHIKMGGKIDDEKTSLHPNDIVNMAQSTNDVFPTAMQLAAVLYLRGRVIPEASKLADSFDLKGKEYWNTIKAGRTHLMDAVPIRLGMEFDAWGRRIKIAEKVITRSLEHLSVLPIGGTALGSGINSPEGFAAKAVAYISEFTDFKFKEAKNKAVGISSHDAMIEASSAINQLAASLVSITTNIRWLSSGPRTGIAELEFPGTEAGSSIMPGKVNPSILEGVRMACLEIVGKHHSIELANMHGSELDLNTTKPLIAKLFLESAKLMADSCKLLNEKCIKDIKANLGPIQKHLDNTLMTVTALTGHIGYDKATEIALKALNEGITLREAALATGHVSEADFDRWVVPEDMV